MLDRFVELGGNFIDTADIYQFGLSETIIGNWLLKRPHLRPRLVLATKVWGPMEDDVNGKGLSRHHIMHAVEQSLRRLQTDYIDLYQVRAEKCRGKGKAKRARVTYALYKHIELRASVVIHNHFDSSH